MILELLIEREEVRLAGRRDRIRPARAKRSDVSHILRTAERYLNEIVKLWESAQ